MILRKLLPFIFLLTLLPLHALQGVDFNEEKPVLYYADTQTYDRELGILILKGNVEFKHEGTTLEANYVTYNEKTDLVTASGNVRMKEADGSVYFAEYVELTGDLKEGIALELRGLLEDDNKIVAVEAHKYENREEFEQAVYTPCELCGDKSPTWQVNAKKVVKDEENQNIEFTDAQLRMFDIPVLYSPYLTQPLVRKTGFLIPQPRMTTDSDLGYIADLPYYIVLSKDKDLTLVPAYLTGQQQPFLGAEYRQAFNAGMFKVEGSITNYRKSARDLSAERANLYTIPSTRGHIFAKGAVDLTEKWRMRGEGGYVSDKTYFRKYVFSRWQALPALTSKGILEGFLNQRDYAAASVQYYQGMQLLDIQDRIPAPLPYLEYSAYSNTDPLGGRFTFDGNLLNIFRPQDINMQRGIGIVGWQRPWVIPSGQVFNLFGSTRGDLYGVEGTSIFTNRRKNSGARFFPQAGVNWNWPFATMTAIKNQGVVLQPTVQLIGAPVKAAGVEAARIPDIDSLDLIYNDVDVFSPDRYPGYDLIDTGSRVTYGCEAITTGTLFGDVELFFGQNYSFAAQTNTLTTLQGMGNGFSDYVGRFQGTPFKWLNFIYRFRLEEQTFAPLVSEVQASVGPPVANFSGTYVFLNRNTRLQDSRTFNQMNLIFSSQFSKYWTIRGTLLQDFQPVRRGGGSLIRSIGLMYRDDCFTIGFTVQRQYFVANDLRPQTLYLLTIGFKNVGEFPVMSYDMDKGLFGDKYNRAME